MLTPETTHKCSIVSLYLWTIRRMVNWAPPILEGEIYAYMNAHKQYLETRTDSDKQKRKQLKIIIKSMEFSFPLRR